jgi:DNA ligase-1
VAWRFQKAAVDERTCKHLVDFLGAEYMAWKLRHVTPAGDDAESSEPLPKPKKFGAPGVLLANKWDECHDPTGWWMSEKLDGVRAYWNGTRFLSRLGNEFTAPAYFTKELPRGVVLDGELFGGRKKFQFTVGIVKSSAKSAFWKNLTYQVFDAPELRKPFEERLAYLEENFGEGKGLEFVRVVEHCKCKSQAQLLSKLKEVEKEGAEGLMLRQPGSMYHNGRSGSLLKVKSIHDYEAKVLAHERGKGKNASCTGALLCVLPNGKKFSVGSGLTDKDRRSPPKIGAIITFRFQELTDSGIPRFPRYIGLRADAKWPPDSPWPP